MRSLWRILALQWLGGRASEALTADSAILEGLFRSGYTPPLETYDVRPEPQVSHRALTSAAPNHRLDLEFASEEALRSGPPRRYTR
jgi:hypothetical protein